ncbi:UNVERIFIED_CONTAM: hypothetical protein FKN15_067437 [Acipenser sinensis]
MVKVFTMFPPSDVQDSATDQDVSADVVDLVDVSDELDYLPPEWSPCFAHTLQHVVCDALEQAGPIKAVITKRSKLFCHKSTKATEALEGHFKLQIANASRWNSQLTMMRSILRVPAEVLSELHATYIRETYNSKFVVTMQSSLEKRLTKFKDMECFQMAATLNPRFKLDWCMGEEVNSIRELLTNKVICLSPKVDAMARDSTSSPPKKRIKRF